MANELTDVDVGFPTQPSYQFTPQPSGKLSDSDVGLATPKELSDEQVGFTKEQSQQSSRVIQDLNTPPLPTAGVAGDAWRAINTAPKPLVDIIQVGRDIQQNNRETALAMRDLARKHGLDPDTVAKMPGVAEQVAKGAGNAVVDLASSFVSPLGLATLGLSALPKVAQRAVSLGFSAQMLSQLPATANAIIEESKKPEDQRDYQKLTELILSGAGQAGFGALAAAHGLTPSKANPAILEQTSQPAAPVNSDTGLPVQLDKNFTPLTPQPINPNATQPIPQQASLPLERIGTDEVGKTPNQTGIGNSLPGQAGKIQTPEIPPFPQTDAGQVTPSVVPAAPEPIVSPNAKPIDVIQKVLALPTKDLTTAFPMGENNLTQSAYRLGRSLATPEDLKAVQDAQAATVANLDKLKQAGDFNNAMIEAARHQFFNEAYQAATGTGSAGLALAKDPNYKPPFPIVEKPVAIAPVAEPPAQVKTEVPPPVVPPTNPVVAPTADVATAPASDIQPARKRVADQWRENAKAVRSKDEYASHVTTTTKDKLLADSLRYADEIEQGKHDGNFTIGQRIHYEMTGKSVPLLPPTLKESLTVPTGRINVGDTVEFDGRRIVVKRTAPDGSRVVVGKRSVPASQIKKVVKPEPSQEPPKILWEMTRAEALAIPHDDLIARQKQVIEFAKHGEKTGRHTTSILAWPKAEAKASRIHAENVLKQMEQARSAGTLDKFISDAHRKAVEQGIKVGTSIPPEVLKDYPELASKPAVEKWVAPVRVREIPKGSKIVKNSAFPERSFAVTKVSEPNPKYHTYEIWDVETGLGLPHPTLKNLKSAVGFVENNFNLTPSQIEYNRTKGIFAPDSIKHSVELALSKIEKSKPAEAPPFETQKPNESTSETAVSAEAEHQKLVHNQTEYGRLQESATDAYKRVGDGNEHLVNSIVENSPLKEWVANDGAEDFEPKNLSAEVNSAIEKINAINSVIKDFLTTESKVRVGTNPTLHTIVRELPKAHGDLPEEKFYEVKNDKTGAIQTVESKDITPVKEQTAQAKLATKGPDLDEQLRALKLEPSTFPDAASKRAAIKRAKGMEEPEPDLGEGFPAGQGSTDQQVLDAIKGEPTHGFKVSIISKDEAVQITGKPQAAGYGGFFGNGQIYLIRENIRPDQAESVRQLLREEIGHGLLRTVEGKKLIDDIFATAKRQLTDAEKALLLAAGYKDVGDQLLDEFIAKSMRENRDWWSEAVLTIKSWLAKLGYKLSNEDAARLLLREIKRRQSGQIDGSIAAGQPAGDQTETPEFKRWFEGSKTVDKSGRPIVFYHGTDANISQFHESDWGYSGPGIYFTQNPEIASRYAGVPDFGKFKGQQVLENGNIIPVFLKIEKPFGEGSLSAEDAKIINTYHRSSLYAIKDVAAEGMTHRRFFEKLGSAADDNLKDYIEPAGYDGIFVRGGHLGDEQEVVVFKPTQIKSAIGNSGAFDRTSPNIAAGPPSGDVEPVEQDTDSEGRQIQIGGRKFLGSESQLADQTPREQIVASVDKAKAIVSGLKLPGATDNEADSIIFKIDGDSNVGSDGKPVFPYDAEVGKLRDQLKQLLGQNDDSSLNLAVQLAKFINYNHDEWPKLVSKPLADELRGLAAAKSSRAGQVLRMFKGSAIGKDLRSVVRNLDFSLKRVWSQNFGGDAYQTFLTRIVQNFSEFFTPEMLDKFGKENPGIQDQLELVTATARAEQANRLYRKIQAKLNPKNITPAKLEKNAVAREEFDALIQQLEKIGVDIPEKNNPKMTAREKLLLLVKDKTIEKVNADVESAVKYGLSEAGKQAARNELLGNKAALEELEGRFLAGEEPTPEQIEKGLELHAFRGIKGLRDTWLGYDPVTVKLAQDILKEDFKGIRFGTSKVKPADTRLNLVELAKQPDAEVARVLNAYLKNIEDNLSIGGATPETRQRIRSIIEKQVAEQLAARKKEFLDNYFNPKDYAAVTKTASEKLKQLMNAGVTKDARFGSDRVRQLLKRIANEYLDSKQLDALAQSTRAEKYNWLDQKAAEIAAKENFNALDEATRNYLDATVRTHLAERLQAAEEKLTRSFLRGNDVSYEVKPVDPKARERSLNEARTKVEGLLRAGAFDASMVKKVAGKSLLSKLTPTISDLAKSILITPSFRQLDILKAIADKAISEIGLDQAQADKFAEVIYASLKPKIEGARKSAQAKAIKSMTPREQVVIPKTDTKLWDNIQQFFNAGGKDYEELLKKVAVIRGLPVPKPEDAARMKALSDKIDELSNLTPEAEARIRNDAALSDEEKAKKIEVERSKVEAINTAEISKATRAMAVEWAKFTKPFNWQNKHNVFEAAYEVAIANILLKVGFPIRLATHVSTQLLVRSAARPFAVAVEQLKSDRNAGNETHFWDDAFISLKDGFQASLKSLPQALRAGRAQLTGRGEIKSSRLASGINALERMATKADEYFKNGDKVRGTITYLVASIRVAQRVVASIDAMQGEMVEAGELRHQIFIELSKQGKSRAEIETKLKEIYGDMQTQWVEALTDAKRGFSERGVTPTENMLTEAADRLLKDRMYQKVQLMGLPSDSMRAYILRQRMAEAWQSPTVGGAGGAITKSMRAVRDFSMEKGLPLMPTYFSNAIGAGVNYHLMLTPFYWFGTGKVSKLGVGDSAWNERQLDRTTRQMMAIGGTVLGGTMAGIIFTRLATVQLHAPQDKKEREKWIAQGHKVGTIEFNLPDGSFIPFSLSVGPFSLAAPAIAAAGQAVTVYDRRQAQQERMNQEAAKKGLEPGKIDPLSVTDILSVAGQAAWASLIGGSTAGGLVSSYSEFQVPNANKVVAATVSPVIPYLPMWQEISRMMGVGLDSKTASVFDYLLPLPTSGARAVNALGDPVRTPNDLQRIIQAVTGGSYPLPVHGEPDAAYDQTTKDAYSALLSSNYTPPEINPAKGYAIGNQFRPMTQAELEQYSTLRGQYLKANLAAVGPNATPQQAKQAYQQANAQALSDMGISSGASGASNLAASRSIGRSRLSLGRSRTSGGLKISLKRLRRSSGGSTRRLRLGRSKSRSSRIRLRRTKYV